MRVLERAAREKGIQGIPHFDIGGTVVVDAQPGGATRQAILQAAGQREQRPAA